MCGGGDTIMNTGHRWHFALVHQVHIFYSLCTLNGIAHKVSFDALHLRINWEQSKWLLYNSLVCLTPDDFQTVYFTTVINRNTWIKRGNGGSVIFFQLQRCHLPRKSNQSTKTKKHLSTMNWWNLFQHKRCTFCRTGRMQWAMWTTLRTLPVQQILTWIFEKLTPPQKKQEF